MLCQSKFLLPNKSRLYTEIVYVYGIKKNCKQNASEFLKATDDTITMVNSYLRKAILWSIPKAKLQSFFLRVLVNLEVSYTL